jgi:hypothetical protein
VPKELKLKCRTKVERGKVESDDDSINEFIRIEFLKFYISIYKCSSSKINDDKYMLDIYLFKGNLQVFMDFAKSFL